MRRTDHGEASMSSRKANAGYVSARRTAALARAGEEVQRSRLEAQDMAGRDEAAKLLGVTQEFIDNWVAKRLLLGFRHSRLGLRLPRWQFAEPIRSAIPRLFLQRRTSEPWALLLWLGASAGALDGRTPRAAMEQGDVERVQVLAGGQ